MSLAWWGPHEKKKGCITNLEETAAGALVAATNDHDDGPRLPRNHRLEILLPDFVDNFTVF